MLTGLAAGSLVKNLCVQFCDVDQDLYKKDVEMTGRGGRLDFFWRQISLPVLLLQQHYCSIKLHQDLV